MKSGIYPLDTARGVEELVKDVAMFANASTEGLLLVGYTTRPQADEEIIDALRPISRDLVDLDRHRKFIRQRITPSLRLHWSEVPTVELWITAGSPLR